MPRRLPLYLQAQKVKFSELDNPHAGLWFEKFFSDFEEHYTGKQKKPLMYQEIINNKAQPNASTLEAYFNRHFKLVSAQQGQTKVFENQWHFVTGMGQDHPIENGFAFHPLLGCPYLAGSAIKGLLRHWVKYYLKDEQKVLNWFGSEDDQNPQIGSLIFFDALPVTSPKLLVDIMTPHYGDWYLKGKDGTIAPDDAKEPIPIPFIVVDKHTQFAISIASRKKGEEAKKDIESAFQELTQAFELLGAGAKTATGYGRFTEDEAVSKALHKKQQNQAEEAAKSPFIKKLEALDKAFTEQKRSPGAAAAQPLREFIMNAMENQLDQLNQEELKALEKVADAYKPSKKQKQTYKALKHKLKEKLS